MRAYLQEVNQGLEEQAWPVTCLLFAPHAPEQNPVEDLWLAGKNWIRKLFVRNKTFAQVKQVFVDFLKNNSSFPLEKFRWYFDFNL